MASAMAAAKYQHGMYHGGSGSRNNIISAKHGSIAGGSNNGGISVMASA